MVFKALLAFGTIFFAAAPQFAITQIAGFCEGLLNEPPAVELTLEGRNGDLIGQIGFYFDAHSDSEDRSSVVNPFSVSVQIQGSTLTLEVRRTVH
jgi:hypothetical protein